MLQAQSSKTGETALVVKLRFLGFFCGVFGLGLLRLSGAWFGLGPGLVLGFTWKSIGYEPKKRVKETTTNSKA